MSKSILNIMRKKITKNMLKKKKENQKMSFDCLVKRFRFHSIQYGDIAVEQYLLIANPEHSGLYGGDVDRA